MIAGNASNARPITHMIGPSSLRNCAATIPFAVPTTPDSAATPSPIHNDSRAPYSTRVSTSRPNASVPNGNPAEGGRNRNRIRIAVGSSPVSTGARIAATVSTTTSTKPTRNERCPASLRTMDTRRRGVT